MVSADKQAKLLSDLLAVKGNASAGTDRPPGPEHAPVVQIANHRPSDGRPGEVPAAGVLYSKGAATASSFRPSYWFFDHEERAEPSAAPARAEPARPVPSASAAPIAPAEKTLPVILVVGFGCLALVVSTTLFALSLWHRPEISAAQPEPALIVAAPTPSAPVVPLPLQPQAAPPAPVASDPPSSVATAPAAESPASSTPSVAALPAPGPNPDTDALLARGDDLLATGDVAAARLFYQRAAEQGNAAAATAVGQTYDPAVLDLLRVRGARGDVQMAAEWYRRAIAAGDRHAETRLKRLLARSPG